MSKLYIYKQYNYKYKKQKIQFHGRFYITKMISKTNTYILLIKYYWD